MNNLRRAGVFPTLNRHNIIDDLPPDIPHWV